MTSKHKFHLGDNVQIIDPEEPPSEWSTFTIIETLSDSYLLSPPDNFTYEPFWVTANEICLAKVKQEKSTSVSISFNFNLSLL